MTAAELRDRVEAEIAQRWDCTNAHHCDLRRCLVAPHQAEFEEFQGPEKVRLWIVLEENPETRDGYKVVFDERTGMFGLALAGETAPFYVGPYGTFVVAFEAM